MDEIRLGRGPMIDTFGRLIGCSHDEDYIEVVDWVNQYINGPWSEQRKQLLEPTAQERANSIKQYIKWRVESSATYRIKQQIQKENDDERIRRAKTD